MRLGKAKLFSAVMVTIMGLTLIGVTPAVAA